MAEASEALDRNKSILKPGESGNFVYVGEMIPNQVIVTNKGDDDAAYTLESGEEGWKLWGNLSGDKTTDTLTLQWFNGFATFTNLSKDALIEIGGNGIFPQGEEPQ
jgi:hypothetical protein